MCMCMPGQHTRGTTRSSAHVYALCAFRVTAHLWAGRREPPSWSRGWGLGTACTLQRAVVACAAAQLWGTTKAMRMCVNAYTHGLVLHPRPQVFGTRSRNVSELSGRPIIPCSMCIKELIHTFRSLARPPGVRHALPQAVGAERPPELPAAARAAHTHSVHDQVSGASWYGRVGDYSLNVCSLLPPGDGQCHGPKHQHPVCVLRLIHMPLPPCLKGGRGPRRAQPVRRLPWRRWMTHRHHKHQHPVCVLALVHMPFLLRSLTPGRTQPPAPTACAMGPWRRWMRIS